MQTEGGMGNKPVRVIISGGGTGGHIYPAIAIADAIKKLQPNAELLFVGAEGRMEMQKVPAAGYKIEGLQISGIQRNMSLQNLGFPLKLLKSVLHSKRIISAFRPDVAVGVGGYASGPLLFMAGLSGIPTLIQEQNGYAGLTNKMLARRANKICVAYPGMERFFPGTKLVQTGNPVRADIKISADLKQEALKYFGLTAGKPVLLVIGGSLGARTINQSIAAGLQTLADAGIQVIWQTGKTWWPHAEAILKDLTLPGIHITEFISRMDLAYNAADAVVSRAGALSISELSLVKLPVILVPSPNVAEDHQTKNAKALSDRGAAILVKDFEARNLLVNEAVALLANKQTMVQLSACIAEFAKPNAAEDIALQVLNLVGR
ncbi:MAG: undecaprenyldiphospho-muramoylpentapeptide beta-N-acetylglucosaminyltransferase [Bacteroidota bacterium]